MSGLCLVACLQMHSLPSHTWQCGILWHLLLYGTYALTATHVISYATSYKAKLVTIVIAYALC